MGKLLFWRKRPFRRGVGIYANSFPYFPADSEVHEGDMYTIHGVNLDLLDNESVLTYAERLLDSTSTFHFMRLVDVGFDFATFVVQTEQLYTAEHTWNIVASPFNPPRSLTPFVML